MFKPCYKQSINVDRIKLTLLTCAKANKLLALLLAFSAISSFPQLPRREADMVASYHVVPYLQHCYASVITSNTVHNHWKYYINVVTQTCSGFSVTDISSDAVHPQKSCIYISQTPHCMLQHINVTFSHLRSKEFISVHKSCVPHSRDTTECTLVYIQM